MIDFVVNYFQAYEKVAQVSPFIAIMGLLAPLMVPALLWIGFHGILPNDGGCPGCLMCNPDDWEP